MGNMSYCMFQNTFGDLEECVERLHDDTLSDSEKMYRRKLVELAREITEEMDGIDLDEDQ